MGTPYRINKLHKCKNKWEEHHPFSHYYRTEGTERKFLWLNVCRTGWYHLLTHTHTHQSVLHKQQMTYAHTDTHTHSTLIQPHGFIRLCSWSSRVRTKRTDTRWSEVAVPRQFKNRPGSMARPLGRPAAQPSLHLTLCMRQQSEQDLQPCWMLQIVHRTGDSPHGRVSLPTQPYAFYILYPCEWQIKTQQVYLTNASAF